MRSLFLRVVLGMLVAVAFGLGANSVVLFRMSREAPALIVEMHEEQLKLVAEQVELAQSPEEARHVARRLAPAMRLPIRLFEPSDPIPPDFSRVQLTSGQILAAPPPPGPPPWGWTLALQSLVVLLGVGVVAWALTAPLLGDLRRLELAVGAFRDDDLTVRVPEVGAPMQPLASAINRLATRVEALVGGQRALLQAVSHELRTPLARLRFHLEELSEGPDPAAVAGADEELAELDGLIGELLTWLKAEVQDGPVVDVDVAAVVHRAVTRLVPEGLAVEVEVHAETARVAERDLERILDNLVSNACRYATAKVHIQASFESTVLAVTVSDDGPGFPADAERLLEPFTTADEARGVAGHGLGLSIVQRICGRYDGRVELGRDPKLGGGQVRVVLAQAVSE